MMPDPACDRLVQPEHPKNQEVEGGGNDERDVPMSAAPLGHPNSDSSLDGELQPATLPGVAPTAHLPKTEAGHNAKVEQHARPCAVRALPEQR